MREIEYFYAAHSAFAYLGSAAFLALAKRLDAKIIHKPIDLRHVVAENTSAAFKDRTPAQYQYFFGREIERWAEYRGLNIVPHTPTQHRADVNFANSMLIAAIKADLDVDQLAHGMLSAHWEQDADLSNRDDLRKICDTCGIDADDLFEAAATPKVKAQYQANTQEALDRHVFGSPTYVLDGDMFYGQDRLEMLERAASQPFRNVYKV